MNDMHIDIAEPDAPAPEGDRVPCHLFMRSVEWPVPPAEVLRADKQRVMMLLPDGKGWLPHDPARLSAWLAKFNAPPRRSWLRMLWDDHHEWVAVGVILTIAAAVAILTNN